MDSPALFLAFGAVMLVVALLGVAVDWFGKPLRHRRFVPKIYRFPDERQPRHSQVRRTEWSDASLVLPVVEATDERLVRYPDPRLRHQGLPTPTPVVDAGPPTIQVPVVDLEADERPFTAPVESSSIDGIVTLEDIDGDAAEVVTVEDIEGDAAQVVTVEDIEGDASDDDRSEGWQTGQYVFNLTPDGREPSATTVRTRYWKNVAATPGASIFGDANLDRMKAGKAPQRLNHRTGKQETMRLPAVQWSDADGTTPVPAWPANEVDPFA